jgi:hypothetical protein
MLARGLIPLLGFFLFRSFLVILLVFMFFKKCSFYHQVGACVI